MNIENSTNVLLSKDINRIRDGHDISRNSVIYSGILHLKNKDIEIRDLITTDTNRDFNNSKLYEAAINKLKNDYPMIDKMEINEVRNIFMTKKPTLSIY